MAGARRRQKLPYRQAPLFELVRNIKIKETRSGYKK